MIIGAVRKSSTVSNSGVTSILPKSPASRASSITSNTWLTWVVMLMM